MFKVLQLFLLTSLSIGFLPNSNSQISVSQKPQNLAGEYSQKTDVSFLAGEDRRTCLSEVSDRGFTGDLCLERTINKVTISKVTELKDVFFVQISIIGGNIHSCDFSGKAKLIDSKLVYEDVIPDQSDICRIEIKSGVEQGIKVSANETCNLYYCGFGLILSGTNEAFKRNGDGYEISHENALKRELE